MNLKKQLKNFLLFFRKYSFLLVLIFSSCAKKNKKVYKFDNLLEDLPSRLCLPYIRACEATYDSSSNMCSVKWQPITDEILSKKLRLSKYFFYKQTQSGFFQRNPFIVVSAHSSSNILEITNSNFTAMKIAVAPVFVDSHNREIIGLLTMCKDKKNPSNLGQAGGLGGRTIR